MTEVGFEQGKKPSRTVAVLGLIGLTTVGALALATILSSDTFTAQNSEVLRTLNRAQLVGIEESQRVQIKDCLTKLELEFHRRWYSISTKWSAIALLGELSALVKDGQLRQKDYQLWLSHYHALDPDAVAGEARMRSKSGAAGELPPPPSLYSRRAIEEAYVAVGHSGSALDLAKTALPPREREYLEKLHQLIEQAVALRASAYSFYYYGRYGGCNVEKRMGVLLAYLDRLKPYAHDPGAQEALAKALKLQGAFFAEWKRQHEAFQYREPAKLVRCPSVQGASAALREAYQILSTSYQADWQHMQRAFFDALCTLDFI